MLFEVVGEEEDEAGEAAFEFGGFEDGLALLGGGEEGSGDEVGHLLRIVDLGQVLEDFAEGLCREGAVFRGCHFGEGGVGGLAQGFEGEVEAQFEAFGDEFEDLLGESADGGVGGSAGVEGADGVDAIGAVAGGAAQGDPGDALKDEVGGAVFVADGGPDEAEAGDGGGGFAGASWFLEGDREHAMGGQGIGEHGTVARFEDVERQHGLGEEDDVGQRHHWHFGRQLHE